jgi:hypothetical protein
MPGHRMVRGLPAFFSGSRASSFRSFSLDRNRREGASSKEALWILGVPTNWGSIRSYPPFWRMGPRAPGPTASVRTESFP